MIDIFLIFQLVIYWENILNVLTRKKDEIVAGRGVKSWRGNVTDDFLPKPSTGMTSSALDIVSRVTTCKLLIYFFISRLMTNMFIYITSLLLMLPRSVLIFLLSAKTTLMETYFFFFSVCVFSTFISVLSLFASSVVREEFSSSHLTISFQDQ